MSSSQELKTANELMRLGKLDEAIAAYNRAIKFNPNSAFSYYYLGEAFAKKGQLKKAISAYYSALNLNPKLAWCCYSLGNVLLQTEQLDRGIEYLRKAINIKPNFFEFHYSLGLALIQQDTVDEAINSLKKSIELNPKFAYSYKSLGDALSKTQAWDEATVFYRKAFELQPKLLGQYFASLALALQKQGLFSQLIALSSKVIKINPESAKELPIILSKDLGELLHNRSYSKSINDRVSYIDISLENFNKFKPTITIHQTIHPQFTPSQPNDKNFVVLIPRGRVWSNDSWGVVVTNSKNEIFIKRMFRKPDITDLASTKNLPPLLNLDGITVFLSSRWGYNYYHWMFDVISRLELVLESGIDLSCVDKFVVNSYQQQFQKDTLDILGIPPKKIIESHQYHHLESDTLIVPSLPAAFPLKWNCDFLRRKFLGLVSKQQKNFERIYVSRKDTNSRRVANETELVDFLNQYGFVSVTLSSMSFQEQVCLFANAKVIITPHGAGLTNIVFCQPETKIIELFASDTIRNCYYITANYCNLEYYYLAFQPDIPRGDNPRQTNLDLVVDLNLLLKLMQKARIS